MILCIENSLHPLLQDFCSLTGKKEDQTASQGTKCELTGLKSFCSSWPMCQVIACGKYEEGLAVSCVYVFETRRILGDCWDSGRTRSWPIMFGEHEWLSSPRTQDGWMDE